MRKIAAAFAMMLSTATFALAGETAAPADAKVYFINLKDGDTVASPVTIRFGLSGMGIAPAGTEIPNTGHHHLIIDAKIEGEALNETIPADEHHIHFGKGQTEAEHAAQAGYDRTLGEHLLDDPPAGGADSDPQCDLASAAGGAHQEQICHVGARD